MKIRSFKDLDITQIIIASRLGYLESNKADKLLNGVDEISKMTMSLIKKIN